MLDRFDFEEEPKPRRRSGMSILDCFSAMVLLITVVVGTVLSYIYFVPNTRSTR